LLAPFLDALAEHIEVDTLHHPAQLRTSGKPHENRPLHEAFQTVAVLSWRLVAIPGGGKVTAQAKLDFGQITFFIHGVPSHISAAFKAMTTAPAPSTVHYEQTPAWGNSPRRRGH